ncbi:hypothetical protein F5Y17DRAFT_418466 [Xylariaceae sp. FL0594]|nr:hypothetical protein F5Y17DRAFT_418466 [Xylariaceae sp. FL0594]
MPTQIGTGIQLSHSPDGVGYKLMELPPEVLEALESANPPELRLVSSATSAILKCGPRSWALRQKNTSNALILLRPSNTTLSSSQIPGPGLTVVSTMHDTIELVPASVDQPVAATKGKWHERFARGR